MFFRRGLPAESIAVGRAFTRRREDDSIEIAEVTNIAPDGFGIQHVRYELTVEKPYSRELCTIGTKLLSLSQFSATFSEARA